MFNTILKVERKAGTVNYLFDTVALGDNLQACAQKAFLDVGRRTERIEIRKQIRTIAAIKMGLRLEPFDTGEVFRAYPVTSKESCRELVREVSISTTIENASFIASGGEMEEAIEIFQEAKALPLRLWEDLVDFEILEVIGDTVKARATFNIPKGMGQDGWILVFRPEEEVFG